MKGRRPDSARAGRLTGHRPISAPLQAASTDLGDIPPELTGAGRDLWIDVVDFLIVNGRSNRVYRHSLRLLCRSYEAAMTRDAGTKTIEAVRRWMAELQLTPASSARGGAMSKESDDKEGPAKLLQLVADKRR